MLLVTCGARGPYCEASQSFINTARQMNFKDGSYTRASNFREMHIAIDRFMSKGPP